MTHNAVGLKEEKKYAKDNGKAQIKRLRCSGYAPQSSHDMFKNYWM